ncbi:hypothetical protein PBI_DEWDROP_24 [Microbacterium phage Dewdrop]|nr:hypothetical protein PBI_LEAF_24 [Microbacterium phage Leaf]QGZ17393.1 hypothetical protein PBI_DEWDROP_24 [Microbacterium phage Dewdrop]
MNQWNQRGNEKSMTDGIPQTCIIEPGMTAEQAEDCTQHEHEYDFSAVPQGKPAGDRVGGDAERTLETCTTCHGAGKYPVNFFGLADENNVRPLLTEMKKCATCDGTGKEVIVR